MADEVVQQPVPLPEEPVAPAKVEFCPNCGAVISQVTFAGVLLWECPEGDYLYPVD